MTKDEKPTSVLGVKLDCFKSINDVMLRISIILQSETSHYICTVNPEFILQAQTDNRFKSLLNASSLSTCDGVGVIYALRYMTLLHKLRNFKLGVFRHILAGLITPFVPLPEIGVRITGIDLFYAICDYAQQKGLSVFLLGGKAKDFFGRFEKGEHDLATLSVQKLKIKYPNLNIIGATSAFSYREEDDKATQEYIHQCMAQAKVQTVDFIFVAYGSSKQENWISRNVTKVPAHIALGIGGTFDFVSEYIPRSPNLIVRLNLEWLFRLIVQPWRLRRIYHAIIKFPLKVFITSLNNQ